MHTLPKILIVDDEPDFIRGIQTVLATKRYQVLVATERINAQQAALAERPDLVLLGTIMPRGDAFLLHQWLRQSPVLHDLPLIVIDAPAEKQLLRGWRTEEGMHLEAEEYLVKPLEPTALVSLVEKLLDKATRRIKVLVVDDHAMIREGIKALLTLHKDVQVIGEATNGKDALEKVVQLSPDVVLMDIVMPVMNGLEATKWIRKECKHAEVLMLTQYDDEENIVASRQAGALGFIPKAGASSQLLAAIRSASQGKRLEQSMAS